MQNVHKQMHKLLQNRHILKPHKKDPVDIRAENIRIKYVDISVISKML